MIKKVFVVLFIVLIILSLGACRDNSNTKDKGNDSTLSIIDNTTDEKSEEDCDMETTISGTVKENEKTGTSFTETKNDGGETGDATAPESTTNTGKSIDSFSDGPDATGSEPTESTERDTTQTISDDGVDLPFHQW